MLRGIGTVYEQWIHSQLIARVTSLTRAVLSTADRDDAVIARPRAPFPPFAYFIQLGAPYSPVDRVSGFAFLVLADRAETGAVKRDIGSRARVNAF